MYIDLTRNNGKKYLRLVKSVRVTNKDGFKVPKKNVVFNIGPLDNFDDGEPDYVSRLRESFRNGCPLIDSLIPFVDNSNSCTVYKFKYIEGDPRCIASTKKYACCLIERILDELGILSAIRSYKFSSKIEYDVSGLAKLLIYGRVLNPQSKIATFAQNNDYYETIADSDYKYHVYDTLDFIYEHKRQIVNRINHNLIKKTGRTNKVIFYDVTNFFFETDHPDEDTEIGGKIEKGIRKNGVSKEERKLPIVQMGLFMDEGGMPISIEMFPGNTLDHQTVQPALSKNIDNVINSRYIFIADRGICNYSNIAYLTNRNKGYIMSKSIKKSTKEEQNWIVDGGGYIVLNESFKYKSRIITRNIKDENEKEIEITQKVIVYWSKKFYDKEIAENSSFLNFLNNVMESPNSFKISSANSKMVRPFLKKEVVNTDTGEMTESSKLKLMIDEEKVERYKSFFGYYQIVTSELKMPDLEVIKHYKRLTQIENQFQIMKSSLDTRPIYVHTAEHIDSHLTICLIALIVMRIIQKKIELYKNQGIKNEDKFVWETGMSGERIQAALNKWCVSDMDGNYFRMCNTNDEDLHMILEAFGVVIPNKFFTKGELKRMKNQIKIF